MNPVPRTIEPWKDWPEFAASRYGLPRILDGGSSDGVIADNSIPVEDAGLSVARMPRPEQGHFQRSRPRPGLRLLRPVDRPPHIDRLVKADFAGVTLGDRVGGDDASPTSLARWRDRGAGSRSIGRHCPRLPRPMSWTRYSRKSSPSCPVSFWPPMNGGLLTTASKPPWRMTSGNSSAQCRGRMGSGRGPLSQASSRARNARSSGDSMSLWMSSLWASSAMPVRRSSNAVVGWPAVDRAAADTASARLRSLAVRRSASR